MSQFHGFCSYPHGGYASAGLLLSTFAAFAATCYAVASCRFVTLTFQTDQGGFEDHFSNNPVSDGIWKSFKASLGLFQWLRPIDDGSDAMAIDYTKGACVGYQESMLAVIQDSMFDVARSFSVISVLMGVICSAWGLVSSCIAWNWLQLLILRVLLFVGTVTAGMSFLMLQADLCTADAIPDASCALDEGGVVLIAGIILWTAAFIVSVAFVKSFSPYEIEMQGLASVDDVEKAQRRRTAARQAALAKGGGDPEVEKARRAGEIAARRAAMMRAHERRRQQLAAMAQSGSPVVTHTPRTNESYSFDSQDSVNSYQNRQRGAGYLKKEQLRQQEQENNSLQASRKSHRSAASSAVLTVDDVTQRNELEVYINEKMQKINRLMDATDSSAEI